MNLFHGGKLAAMPPKLLNDEGDVEVLRPLIYCAEPDLAKFAEAMAFPIIPCDLCGSQEGLQRNAMKAMLDDMEAQDAGPQGRDDPRAGQCECRAICSTRSCSISRLRASSADDERIDIDRRWPTILREAAKAEILPRFRRLDRRRPSTPRPAPTDLVTEADTEAERLITAEIDKRWPEALVVGEEAVAADPALLGRAGRRRLAVTVDPVDGTANFAAGLPLFAVMAAVVVKGETVAGIIYDPMGDDWVLAERGGGAWLRRPDGRRVRLKVAAPVPLARDGRACLDRLPAQGEQAAGARQSRQAQRSRPTIACAGHDYRTMASGHCHCGAVQQADAVGPSAGHADLRGGRRLCRAVRRLALPAEHLERRPADRDRPATAGVFCAARSSRYSRSRPERRRSALDHADYWAIADADIEIQNPVTDRKLRLLDDYCDIRDGLQRARHRLRQGLGDAAMGRALRHRGHRPRHQSGASSTSRGSKRAGARQAQLHRGTGGRSSRRSPASYDVVLCLGAAFALGGFVAGGRLDGRRGQARRRGGDRRPDAQAPAGGLHAPASAARSGRAASASIERHGAEVSALISASDADFERYASHHRHATLRWAREHPSHPDHDDVLDKSRDRLDATTCRRIRPMLGWTIFVGAQDRLRPAIRRPPARRLVLGADAEQPAASRRSARRPAPACPCITQASALGVSVPLNCWPMKVPMIAPPTVCMKPNTAAAVPATAPSGSIDSEFMFELAQAKTNCSTMQQRVERPRTWTGPIRLSDQDRHARRRCRRASTRWLTRRMPKRLTIARVEEVGDRHQRRDAGEGDREQRPEPVDADEDLLRADDEAEHARRTGTCRRGRRRTPTRLVNTSAEAVDDDAAADSGRRYSGCSVSGSRNQAQTPIDAASTAMNRKM